MGLDEFSKSSTTSNRTADKKQREFKAQDNESDKSEEESAYKVVSTKGSLEKRFPTEEDWNKTIEVIENDMGYSEWEVMNMESSKRHQVLHNAILKKNDSDGGDYNPVKHCIICNKKFVFPSNWNFVKFRNEAVCTHHQVGDVMEEISKINSIDGNSWD